jgi:hydroxyacylglutathione hydrolase
VDIDFVTGAPVRGDLDVSWNHGTPKGSERPDPPIQVHSYDEHTYVLRQSKDVSYEAPFVYLMFGNRRALLLDTGATADASAFPLRDTVDGLLGEWLRAHPREEYELVVAHTHGHGDHRAGDEQLARRPDTRVVDRRVRPLDRSVADG